MALLHKEYCEFNNTIKLNSTRKDSLKTSRKEIKRKIRTWFKDNKKDEIQPKFKGQGSFEMNTTVNPIPIKDENGNNLLHYDLDYGVYFIEKEGGSKKRTITTWHDWVYEAVKNHTNTLPIKKTTCVRVIFADGHHIDLPIYYMKESETETIKLAHKSKSWIESDPKAFFEWFNEKKKDKTHLEKIVRFLKAWKDFRENENSNLKFPSGFELTILATNNYVELDNADEAFKETVNNINTKLNALNGFRCERPTKPVGENVFADYSETRKKDFLNSLNNLVTACKNAKEEKNRKKASEILQKQFGTRFPLGADIDDETKSNILNNTLAVSAIKPKPFCH